MTREEFNKLEYGSVVCHVKHNHNYMLRDKHLRMKNPTTGEWVDAITYVPIYENNEKLFCREESSFIEEFELK